MNPVCSRFLCDENVNRKVIAALRDRGIDAVHVVECGLMGADDTEIMAAAVTDDRIVVTSDYTDFGALVGLHTRHGIRFPGVLFISPSIPQGDAGALLQAIETWIELCETGLRSIQNTVHWLTLPGQDDGFDRRVREAMEPYLAVLNRVS